MRKLWGVALAAVLAGAGACGSDPGTGSEAAAPATGTLSSAGTPLAAGLVVPVGTELVGPVFPRTPDATARARGLTVVTSDVAVLQVDGDPFAAWDALAAQARDVGVPVPGSGICTWHRALPLDDPTVVPPPQTPVTEPRPDLADTLDCRASARGPRPDGTQLTVDMRLWWWAEGAELHVEISDGGTSGSPASYPETDPGPAPAAASAQLPERDAPTPVEVGDPFGRENNCVETGYDTLTVPAGARFVGGGTTPGLYDFAAVLAVDDPEAVLAALRDQLDGPDSSDGSYGLGEVHLADGTPVWSLTGGVSAGGGACEMWSTPDGSAVLVTTTSD